MIAELGLPYFCLILHLAAPRWIVPDTPRRPRCRQIFPDVPRCTQIRFSQLLLLNVSRCPFQRTDFLLKFREIQEELRTWGLGGLEGHSYCNYYEKNYQKAPWNYSASFWTSNFSIALWESPNPPSFSWFGDFRTCPWALEPTISTCRHQDTLKNPRKIAHIFGRYSFWRSDVFGNSILWKWW